MEILNWYKSVPVKDNCALFAPTPLLYTAAGLYSMADWQWDRYLVPQNVFYSFLL